MVPWATQASSRWGNLLARKDLWIPHAASDRYSGLYHRVPDLVFIKYTFVLTLSIYMHRGSVSWEHCNNKRPTMFTVVKKNNWRENLRFAPKYFGRNRWIKASTVTVRIHLQLCILLWAGRRVLLIRLATIWMCRRLILYWLSGWYYNTLRSLQQYIAQRCSKYGHTQHIASFDWNLFYSDFRHRLHPSCHDLNWRQWTRKLIFIRLNKPNLEKNVQPYRKLKTNRNKNQHNVTFEADALNMFNTI